MNNHERSVFISRDTARRVATDFCRSRRFSFEIIPTISRDADGSASRGFLVLLVPANRQQSPIWL